MSFKARFRRGARVAAALALVALPAQSQEVKNPQLFTKSLEAATEALEHYRPYDNPRELERVNDIGYRLAAHSGYEDYPFSFFLVDMPIPNAFALPGGHIFITRGMLDLGLDDDMLAGLLGHEIAHVTQEHFLRMKKRATLLNILSQVLTVGALVGASQSDSRSDPYYGRYPYPETDNGASLVQGAAAAGAVISELLLRSYSRENEDESDEEGQRFAAAAGFNPDGTRRLMSKMELRLPQSRTYGYWQTHPFFEERVRAARARRHHLTIKPGESADAYRQKTQATLLGFAGTPKLTPPMVDLLKSAALKAWPRGAQAEGIRLERLHRLRDDELERVSLSRDYGKLIVAYEEELEVVSELTPESPTVETLRQELGELRHKSRELYPRAAEVFAGGVFETSFLETFLSNYPDAAEVQAVALELGIAYSRLGRQADAVEQFLKAWREDPQSEGGQRARTGLRNLAPVLNQLGALQHLAAQDDDPELRRLSSDRLDEQASRYDDLANGADYLKRFPEGSYVETVSRRLNHLAETLYREMRLYQELGDTQKALARVNQILRYAPLSPAAERLQEQAVKDLQGAT